MSTQKMEIKIGRNVRLTEIAGALRQQGLGADAVFDRLVEHPERDGLPEAEVRAIARSICRYPAGGVAKDDARSTAPNACPSKRKFGPDDWAAARERWKKHGAASSSPVKSWMGLNIPRPANMTVEGAMTALGETCGFGQIFDSDTKTKRPAIEIPFRAVDGKLTGSFKSRFIESSDTWPKTTAGELAKKSKSYGPVNLIGADRLLSYDPSRPVFILAGEKDLITAILHGIQAVAVAGEGIRKINDAEVAALKTFNVFILYDADAVGLNAAPAMARVLRSKGVGAKWIRPRPEWRGKDLTEWISNGLYASTLIAGAGELDEVSGRRALERRANPGLCRRMTSDA